jgi:hypothetical protein
LLAALIRYSRIANIALGIGGSNPTDECGGQRIDGMDSGLNVAPGTRSGPLHHLLDFAQVGECLEVVVRLQHQP